ncbi:MAG TPA: hypothetical protein VFQ60_05010 [Patescibacteria group bacterium]|nr:hypothetical protein [Patescibacteria group bacterium]
MRIWKSLILLFLFALAFFILIQPWGGFPDPDAFVHAKETQWIIQHGPLLSFPWLDLTLLGSHFADLEFLHHVLLIPFVYLFGPLWGVQIAGVVFASAFFVLFFLLLKRLRAHAPFFWSFLLFLSPAMVERFSLSKPSPLAIGLFLFGLTAYVLKKPLWVFLAGFVFALSHGGWSLLLVSEVALLCGAWLFDVVVEGMPIRSFFSLRPWALIFWSAAGTALGVVIHPNFPHNLTLLWTQLVQVAVLTSFHRVFLGAEWLPAAWTSLVVSVAGICFASLAFVFGWTEKRAVLDLDHARNTAGFSIVLAGLFALSIKSFRMIEYFVPFFIFFLALLVSSIRIKRERGWQFVRNWFNSLQRWFKFLFAGLILLCSAGILIPLISSVLFLRAQARPFMEFAKGFASISRTAEPGDRVFHSSWDQFPELFFLDDRLRYISGLDPTFLLAARPDLSDAYRDLTRGTRQDAYFVIHELFHAKFVFAENHDAAFLRALASDPRFVRLSADERTSTFRVE